MGTLVKNNRSLFPTTPSLFNEMFEKDWLSDWPFTNNNLGRTVPAVNVRETNDAYELEVAAPGMSKQDFKIELNNNMLVISTDKQHEEQDDNSQYTRREFNYHSFMRSFSLSERLVKGDQISAKYHDGVLYITIPKAEEAKAKPARKIEIE